MHQSTGNDILDAVALSNEESALFIHRIAEKLYFPEGEELQRSGSPLEWCFFPVEGALSILSPIGDISVNTLMIGFDGAVNINPGPEPELAACTVVSRLPGRMWRIGITDWYSLVDTYPEVRRIVGAYTNSLSRHLQGSLACERQHDVETRLCRYLYELHRWHRGKPLPITHLAISQLLSVRRTTVTLLAKTLQNAHIISYRRGITEVVDVFALQQAGCECGQGHHVTNSRGVRQPLEIQLSPDISRQNISRI